MECLKIKNNISTDCLKIKSSNEPRESAKLDPGLTQNQKENGNDLCNN